VLLPRRAEALWRLWTRPRTAGAARLLVTAALALLFLHAAGTVELVYTIRVSYVLVVGACVVGAPYVVLGWLRLPVWLRWFALALLVTYVLAATLADTTVLPSQDRGSSYRGIAYLTDLMLGLAVVGLLAGLWPGRSRLRPLAWALVGGATVGAAYGLYQWAAQRFGLPLEDVNNAVNSDGVTRGGGFSQGRGLLGGERIKGTFVEPHFFATFLASTLPLAICLFYADRRRRRLALAAVLTISFALVLTSSVPAWAALFGGMLGALAIVGVSRGLVALASIAGSALVVVCVLCAVVIADPASVSSATGRAATELTTTTEFRVNTWERVLTLWAARPVIGFGPGQGAVRLATRADSSRSSESKPPLVLGTAEGLWSAALLDGGVLAFSSWVLFLGGYLVFGGRGLYRAPEPLMFGLFAATATAVLVSQVGGDRLELRVWLLLGCLAAACGLSQAHGDERHKESGKGSA
jgi:hypothetical protein